MQVDLLKTIRKKFLILSLIQLSLVSVYANSQTTIVNFEKDKSTAILFDENDPNSLMSQLKYFYAKDSFYKDSIPIQGIDLRLIELKKLDSLALPECPTCINEMSQIIESLKTEYGEDSVIFDPLTGEEEIQIVYYDQISFSTDLTNISRITIIDYDNSQQKKENSTYSGRRICFSKKYPNSDKYLITFSISLDDLEKVLMNNKGIDFLKNPKSYSKRKKELLLYNNYILNDFLLYEIDINQENDPHFGVYLLRV